MGKLETLGPKSDKIVSSWGFRLASDVPDLELTKPEMSENADKKSLFSLAKGPGKGQLRKIDTLQKITASVWQNIKLKSLVAPLNPCHQRPSEVPRFILLIPFLGS